MSTEASVNSTSANSTSTSSLSSSLLIANACPNNDTPYRRRRKAVPSQWHQNIQHRNRMLGLEYTNRKGDVTRPAKVPRVMEDCKCRFKCHTKVSPDHQVALFERYLELGDTGRQKAYLSPFIIEKPVERKRPRKSKKTKVRSAIRIPITMKIFNFLDVKNKAKSVSRSYYVLNENQKEVRVCQKFFRLIFQVRQKY